MLIRSLYNCPSSHEFVCLFVFVFHQGNIVKKMMSKVGWGFGKKEGGVQFRRNVYSRLLQIICTLRYNMDTRQTYIQMRLKFVEVCYKC